MQDNVNAGDDHHNLENDKDQENCDDNPLPDQGEEESDSSEDEVGVILIGT